MRALFFLLVLANLLLFAWGQGYFGGRETGREPQRLADQLNPKALRIVPDAPAAAAKAAPVTACRKIAALPAEDAARLAKAAEQEGWQVTTRTADAIAAYIVRIPDLATRAAAEKKAAELRALGIVEFAVTPAGSQFAISFAELRGEAAARELLAALGKKGVRSARVEPRAGSARADLEVRAPADRLEARLPDLLAGVPAAVAIDCPP